MDNSTNKTKPKQKHKAFRLKDWESLKLANRKIKSEVFKTKMKFKDKLESEFANMNTKQAFQKVKILTGCESNSNTCTITDPESFAKELNTFFAQFDILDFTAECEALLEALPLPEVAKPAPFRGRCTTPAQPM